MHGSYAKDLDLNLLRVFVVVAEEGSVTRAASRLYLTQPAVSAALRRLGDAVGAPLLVRSGRGVALTARGERLLADARPHLLALIDAATAADGFDPATSDRTMVLGLSDGAEGWLLGPLLRRLAIEAPLMTILVRAVQFRTVGDALATVDMAISVADELPADIRRREVFHGSFVCLVDPRHVRCDLTLDAYLEQEHVIVSYNGDMRGVVEDFFGLQRRVRVSVPTFHAIGALVDGSALVATVPERIAREILDLRPHLRTVPVPLPLTGTPVELLWRAAVDDDAAGRWLRDVVTDLLAI